MRVLAKVRCSASRKSGASYEISGKISRDAGKVHIAAIAPQSTDETVDLMRDFEGLPSTA